MKTVNVQLQDTCINTIRILSAEAVQKANSGHPGTPMGLAPLGFMLWTAFLKHNPRNPKWPGRDRFILSAGHASMLLYSLLYLTGYDLSLEDIKHFRQWGSRTPGHPEYGHTPGVEVTTGPLGQGFGMGVGMGIARRFLGNYFNRPGHDIVDHYIYAICSDGDLMEGVSAEAASLAGNLGLGELIYFYDDNNITIEGRTDLTFSHEDTKRRFEAYGWQVLEVPDGNDTEDLSRMITQAQDEQHKPSLIIVRTHIGFGSPKQDSSQAHGEPLGEDELRQTKKNLNWPQQPPFYVPQEALDYFRQACAKGQEAQRQWEERFAAYERKYPELARQWHEFHNGQLPEGWDQDLPEFKTSDGPMATRSASGLCINALAPKLLNLIGGAGDLAPSTNTYMKGMGDFSMRNNSGRNLHFGVREHGMGAVINGLLRHEGLIPFGATFLIFSDYMRPSIRLAALMNIPAIYIFTHDSIGLGEDGPTHQPVEQLMSLRAIPNMTVIRPADANETREAWHYMITQRKGPMALVLTRQKLPVLDRPAVVPAGCLENGAYIAAEAQGALDIILIATGSEVCLALKARQKLQELDIPTRVVSMPSWEIFEAQPQEYRDKVLPPVVKRRIAIEAGSPLGWCRYVGAQGDVIGLDHFGASAPGPTVMEKFGFTAENIVHRAKLLMERTS